MTAKTERRAAPRPGREARHRAREAAVQMLYQWEVGRTSMSDVAETFWLHDQPSTHTLADDHRAFATSLAIGVVKAVAAIDPIIAEAAEHWRLERMTRVDRNVLRLGAWELARCADIPRRVTLNESIELAKRFGTETSASFVNGVLDRIASDLEKE